VVEIEHKNGQGTVFAASGVEFTLEKLLHVAAVVKTRKRVADSLRAERFAEAEVGYRERKVFGDGGGEVAAASKGLHIKLGMGNEKWRIVVLDGQSSDGEAIGDKGNAD
jgi:hypothetical protein